ncbi:MAG TPA: hypothetical protein VGD95_07720 [Micavibrio sp.]
MMVAIPLMKQLVLEGLMRPPGPRLPRISFTAIGLTLCAVLLGFMTLAILLVAEYLYLVQIYMAPYAALIVAATSLALTLLTWGAGKMISYNKNNPSYDEMPSPPPDIAKTVSALIDSIAEELEEPIRDNPKTAVAIAGLAGFLAGDQVRP